MTMQVLGLQIHEVRESLQDVVQSLLGDELTRGRFGLQRFQPGVGCLYRLEQFVGGGKKALGERGVEDPAGPPADRADRVGSAAGLVEHGRGESDRRDSRWTGYCLAGETPRQAVAVPSLEVE